MSRFGSRCLRAGERSQTALEYILLIAAGVVFIVIVSLVVRNQVLSPAGNRVATNASAIKQLINNVSASA